MLAYDLGCGSGTRTCLVAEAAGATLTVGLECSAPHQGAWASRFLRCALRIGCYMR